MGTTIARRGISNQSTNNALCLASPLRDAQLVDAARHCQAITCMGAIDIRRGIA